MHRLGVHVHVVGRMFLIAFFSSRHSLSSMRKQPTERTAKGNASLTHVLRLLFCRRDRLWITSRTHHLFPREMTTKPVVHGGIGKCGLFSQAIISERLVRAKQCKLACVSFLSV